MSVASKNPFALLDEGVDEPSPSSTAAPAPPAPPAPAPARDNQKASKGPASRGGKYYQRGGARSSAFRGDGNPNQNGVEDAESVPKKFDGRGRGRGGRGGQRGGRRPFDRHSATGKTDSDKKVHQGWGGDDGNTELQAEAAATVDAAVEATSPTTAAAEWGAETSGADAWAAPAADSTEAPAVTEDKPEGRPRREQEEEDNTLTLEQYLAQQKEKELSVVPKLEGRRANEGADADLWKDVVPLQKGDEDSYFVGKGKAAPKARAKKEEKVFIEIDARFDRPNTRGGRGRGDGNRGRGGRGGRGGNRGGRQDGNGRAPAALNVDDETAFPSLS